MGSLVNATLELARELHAVDEGIATGGSTTTLVDSNNGMPADHYVGGTIWFLSGANAGKSAIVTAFSGTTFTFANPGAACQAGDRYAAADNGYPRQQLIAFINDALASIGDTPAQDSSLTVVAHQTEYDLPAGVSKVLRVEQATTNQAPYDYQLHCNWNETPGHLEFDPGWEPTVAGRTLRLTYRKAHAALAADADLVDGLIHPDKLKWEAAVHALAWRVGRTEGQRPHVVKAYNDALLRATQMAMRHQTPGLKRDPHLARW